MMKPPSLFPTGQCASDELHFPTERKYISSFTYDMSTPGNIALGEEKVLSTTFLNGTFPKQVTQIHEFRATHTYKLFFLKNKAQSSS